MIEPPSNHVDIIIVLLVVVFFLFLWLIRKKKKLFFSLIISLLCIIIILSIFWTDIKIRYYYYKFENDAHPSGVSFTSRYLYKIMEIGKPAIPYFLRLLKKPTNDKTNIEALWAIETLCNKKFDFDMRFPVYTQTDKIRIVDNWFAENHDYLYPVKDESSA